jgi:indolepyruvate ferredoxin oxidoreductase
MTTLTASATIGDRFAADSGRFPLSGVQALIRLIVDVRRADRAQDPDTAAFVSGYEGSLLAGLDLELQCRDQLLAEHDIVFRPATRQRSAWRRRSGSLRARSWTGWSATGPPT